MQILVLSSKGHYAECEEKNYGDCFIIDTGDELIIYDCGAKEIVWHLYNAASKI